MTSKPFPRLFRAGRIDGLHLKNRLMMAPMVRNYADADGKANARFVAHIDRVARGGVGAIILEAAFVSPEGRGFSNELGLHEDSVVPALRKVTAAAHRHGCKIGIQLYHAGRQTSQKTTGVRPIAPSSVPDPTVNELPEEMNQLRIRAVVEAYGRAAQRARSAGCDFVEIHGAHGYLVTQFLSSFSNRRTDRYGGSFANRTRFLREVYAAIRAEVGGHYPVSIRLSADELVEGGITLKESVATAKLCEELGISAIHVSVGNYASYAQGRMIPPMATPDGTLVSYAAAFKKSLAIPVIAVGKIRTPQMAERVLREDQADFVALGRPLLADPDWVVKAQAGKAGNIHPCIACNQGCISRLFAQQDVWCTVNPETGRESEFSRASGKRKTVVVAGGGPAGMSAAKTAATRGHRVILYEKSAKLGGQLFAAEAAPHREGWRELRHALVKELDVLGVDVRLKTACTAARVKKDHADVVIVAVGSSALKPHIPGIGRTNVVISRDVLEGRSRARGRVVVIGGGCAGAQTAEFLAKRGHAVSVLEATGDFAIDAPVDERVLLLGRLARQRVKLLGNTRALAIGAGGVTVEDATGRKNMPADTVVICLGSYPNDGLVTELKGSVKKIRVVGDAVEARRVTEAMAEGALAALKL
jgi:2,4-dienoyl-CoA reductase-like NADH-dependent reductase (Old Yellow Enzyme family)/thioredoxin reductase